MSNEIVLRQLGLALPADRQLRQEFERQIKHMAAIAEVTKSSMREIGEITEYASFEATRTYAILNLLERAATTSRDKAALAEIRQEFGEHMQQVTEVSNTKIIGVIKNLPTTAQKTIWDALGDALGL